MRGKRNLVLLTVAVLVVVLAGCGGGGGQTKKPAYPDKPIEFVVPYGAGGGSDVLARNIVQSIQDLKLTSQVINVVNKPGANGQLGGAYVLGKKGDPYFLMTMVSGQVSIPLTIEGGIPATKYTPLANLAMDEFLLLVEKDSPFKTIQDVIAKAKTGPKVVSLGGTATGSEDHMCTGLLEKAAGVQFNYIPFEGGGQVMTNLLGKHVDVAWANPNECLSQLQAGLVRAVAVAAPERVKLFPDVPTLKESGYDAVFQQFRGVVGPPEMPEEAVKFWADTLKKVSEDSAWQKRYAEQNGLTIKFLGPNEFKSLLASEEQRYAQILKDIGQIK